MQPQTFRPDDEYCVYCHAVAAGPCADCGALCCVDCVDVVLRFTSRRAVCKPCLRAEPSGGPSRRRWMIAGLLIAGAVLVLLLLR